MRIILPAVSLLIVPVFLIAAAGGKTVTAGTSPEGYWQTLDDKTGEKKSIVKIWIDADGTLKGRIVEIFPGPGEDPEPLCDKCRGRLKDQKIIGMVFMWGFEQKGDKWVEGEIVDPENGRQYHCQVYTRNNGRELKVYGYIRLIVKVGRTQTWIRAERPL
ncbi:MAG: DUF2147 domain-containing protein [Acidobacteriota bacterium]|jgi:uncharacterized protein (DUF2147 family)|nr:DUF2147 domain-containing protein [Acidobacteriota bacterium]